MHKCIDEYHILVLWFAICHRFSHEDDNFFELTCRGSSRPSLAYCVAVETAQVLFPSLLPFLSFLRLWTGFHHEAQSIVRFMAMLLPQSLDNKYEPPHPVYLFLPIEALTVFNVSLHTHTLTPCSSSRRRPSPPLRHGTASDPTNQWLATVPRHSDWLGER